MARLTETLVTHCVERAAADRPGDVDDRLRKHVLDTVGVAVGGQELAESSPTFERAVDTLTPDTGGEATVLPTGESLPAGEAALLNGAFAHSLDFDDTHRESSLHPGAPVIPAALAVGEREGATVGEFLDAVRVGYDVACAVGRAVNPDAHYDRGFHITATCGTFGATAAAGVVASLSEAELTDAFGVNGSQAAGSLQFLANGAWNKRLHPGLAARRAVTAVALAGEGFRGAADPLEGDNGFLHGYTGDPNPGAIEEIGEREGVLETALKPYPCCRYMHSALDALTGLAAEVDATDVTSVTVDIPKPGVRLTGDPIEQKRRPENFVDCQFSMPFGAALALTRGDAGLDAFLDAQDHLDDADLRRLMDVTDVVTTDEVMDLFPERWAARVVVEAGETRHERFVEAAPGEPERPLDWDATAEKFRTLVDSPGTEPGVVDALVETVRDVEDGRPVADLVAAIRDVA